MRNDNAKWAAPLEQNRADVVGKNARLSLQPLSRQTMLSGPAAQCLALADQPSASGWPDIARGESYAIRLRRDRILAVNGPALTDGWHERSGVAVSDMTGGYAACTLSGPRALDILKTGTALELALPSGSAMQRFHRQEVIIYRWQAEDTFRIHTQRGQLESLWGLLAALVVK
ncbi:MAG: hypothetical protein GQ535_07960 [Rhodobacteraceae bacterium]|nr:hypothetical protein [Paracoccaceae bacterium]